MTSFPPPPGFTGWQNHKFGNWGYERECTPDEARLLQTAETAASEEHRAEQEALRDAWFEDLRQELAGDGQGPA